LHLAATSGLHSLADLEGKKQKNFPIKSLTSHLNLGKNQESNLGNNQKQALENRGIKM
jgi:hypothetical protein